MVEFKAELLGVCILVAFLFFMFIRNSKCNRIEGFESSDERKWAKTACAPSYGPGSGGCSTTYDNQIALNNNLVMIYNKIKDLESKIENLDLGTSLDMLHGGVDRMGNIIGMNTVIECHDDGIRDANGKLVDTPKQYMCPEKYRPTQPCACRSEEREYKLPDYNLP